MSPAASHAGHSHGVSPAADRRRLWLALLVIVGFMLAEVVVGLLAHSLALLSDAGHMLTDAASIGLSLVALRLAQRPPRGGLTYGLKRAEILSALTNGATLLALAVLIVYEASRRLLQPPAVNGRLVLVVALTGIVVNLFATWQLSRAERKSLNIQGSFQHILTDLYAFIATAVAALVIIATGYTRADPLVSFLIAALMLRAAYGLLRDAGRVLMEAAPAGMSAAEVGDSLARHPQVVNVHDFHLWEITSGMPALSAHVLVRPGEDCHAIRRELEQLLDERYEIEHTTLQVDHAGEGRPIQVRRLGEEEHPERRPDQG